MEQNVSHCHCGTSVLDHSMLVCEKCSRYFHIDCLQSNRPASLHGDTLFTLICARCANGGQDVCVRMNLPWVSVVMLALYNLQASSAGKCGFFRWRTQICPFIDQNWTIFFGDRRKKTHTWQGTVAGTLSAGCPQYFTNGTSVLHESGWWRLTENRPPTRNYPIPKSLGKKVRKRGLLEFTDQSHMSGLRSREKKSPLLAAVELRAKRDNRVGGPEVRQQQKKNITDVETTFSHDAGCAIPDEAGCSSTATTESSETSAVLIDIKQEKCDVDVKLEPIESQDMNWSTDIKVESSLPKNTWTKTSNSDVEQIANTSGCLLDVKPVIDGDDEDENFDIDPCTLSPRPDTEITDSLTSKESNCLPQMDELMDIFSESGPLTVHCADVNTGLHSTPQEDKPTPITSSECASETDTRDASEDDSTDSSDDDICPRVADVKVRRPWTKRNMQSTPQVTAPDEPSEPPCKPMMLYEETQLLRRLEHVRCRRADVARFRRKLLLRQMKRQCGLPVFDIDQHLLHLSQTENTSDMGVKRLHGNRLSASGLLDRYQVDSRWSYDVQPKSFLHRLVGVEDDQLQNVISPYTARVLKPFIWRDRESLPLKLKLLQEIKSYYRKKHLIEDREVEPSAPTCIDYCYVRAQHIPAVNSLCAQFFWPGVDLSECLQYPDFSCVVLYRRLVIGFAFMVPDVTFNEAYISFIFTHPEWRRAGIATFMLYHLIQTCMGKDVTLHVSASNPAMLLYQRFGFKAEQFIVGFYDKYFPAESNECRNAFFLRLQR